MPKQIVHRPVTAPQEHFVGKEEEPPQSRLGEFAIAPVDRAYCVAPPPDLERASLWNIVHSENYRLVNCNGFQR